MEPNEVFNYHGVADYLDARVKTEKIPSRIWIAKSETLTVDFAHRISLELIRDFAKQGNFPFFHADNGRVFFFGEEYYYFFMAEHPLASTVFTVVLEKILRVSQPLPKMFGQSPVEGPGRFESVVVKADATFTPILDQLAESIAKIMSAGNLWCYHQAMFSLCAKTRPAVEELLLPIRKRYSASYCGGFLPYALTNRGCIYLPDTALIQLAIKNASPQNIRIDQSPISLVAELFTQTLPDNMTLSSRALQDDVTITFEANKVSYVKSNPTLLSAELAFFHKNNLAIVPVVRQGNVRLVFGVLIDTLPEFERIVKNDISEFNVILKRVTSDIVKYIRYVNNFESTQCPKAFYDNIDPNLLAWGTYFFMELANRFFK